METLENNCPEKTVQANDKSLVVQDICAALILGDAAQASQIACEQYPFHAPSNRGRRYTELTCTRIFVRDGFIDRYTGQHLVFPGALRLLSCLLPREFPFHLNWKMSESHIAYWELFPTIDHIVPVARGGADNEINWVSTSMIRNSAKSNWTLEELGWQLLPPGDYTQWDGLMGWFLKYIEQDPTHRQNNYLKRWHSAARLTAAKGSILAL